MKPIDKKNTVFQILSQETNPVSLKHLLNKLPPNYSERSVRRWLQNFVQEGSVDSSGKKRAMKYQARKNTTKAGKETQSGFFTSKSLPALEYLHRPLYERKPSTYSTEWFDAYIPNASFYLTPEIKQKLYNAGARASNHDKAGTYAHHILNRLLIDLSFNSSRLEGNTYSLLDTERLILSGTGVEGKLDEEKVMILNHKESIRYLVENAPRLKINFQTICTLHYLLSEGLVESKYAGKVRDHTVRILGSTYIPFEDPIQIQRQLEKIANKASVIKDPFEQSLFLLIHVSYIQAFTDVNKRTARISANIPLIISNLVPLSFNDINREDYTSSTLAVYELQDIHPMVDLFVFSYLRTCAAYDATIKSIGYDEIRVRYRSQRRDLLRKIISNKLNRSEALFYTTSEAHKEIPEEQQSTFIKDVQEDLEQMDQSRMAGLGIDPLQLNEWRQHYGFNSDKNT